MATKRKYAPRLSVELSEEQKAALDATIGQVHGLQRAVFSIIVDDLIKVLLHPNAELFLGALLSRKVGLLDLMDLKVSADGDDSD